MSDDRFGDWIIMLQCFAIMLCLVFFGPQMTLYIMLGFLCLWLLLVVGVLVVISSPMRRFNNLLKGLFIKLFKLERLSINVSPPKAATDPKVSTAVVPADLQTMLSYLNAGHHSLADEELSIQLRDAIVETEYFAMHFMTQAAEATIMAQLKLIQGLLADCQVAKACPAALVEVVKYDVLRQQALASVNAYRQIIAAQLAASVQELHTRFDDAADSILSIAAASREVHMHR